MLCGILGSEPPSMKQSPALYGNLFLPLKKQRNNAIHKSKFWTIILNFHLTAKFMLGSLHFDFWLAKLFSLVETSLCSFNNTHLWKGPRTSCNLLDIIKRLSMVMYLTLYWWWLIAYSYFLWKYVLNHVLYPASISFEIFNVVAGQGEEPLTQRLVGLFMLAFMC